jgi:asparagine synthase (glutamine-hydrolysing)
MSGFIGIVNWDGAPVAGPLLQRMIDVLSARGPDGQAVWVEGPVGLGHTWLRTAAAAASERQPYSVDERVWIIADARLDRRADLVAQLGARGCRGVDGETDAGLILHAYRVWDETCLERVHGDFAFAIWDAPRRRLFCARDRFGVKPFFYAEGAGGLVFGNTLDCVRLHPAVSSAPDDEAIADFLALGFLRDPSATCFAGVRRLPAAHHLVGSGRVHCRRYWTLPIDEPIRYRRTEDYVDHFRELLGHAVADRLHCRRAGVLMSGGLDSTTIAGTAMRCLARGGPDFDLRAYTTVCERVLEDPERRYAQLAADALGIPIHYRIVDRYRVYERWDEPALRRPEPEADPLFALHVDQLQDAAAHAPVVLTGYGADPALRVPIGYAVDLLGRGKILRLASEIALYVRVCRRLPRIRVGAHMRRWLGSTPRASTTSPAWLHPRLASRCGGDGVQEPAAPSLSQPTRQEAWDLLASPDWPAIFETYDAGVTGVPVDVRHPFFDLRVVQYLLSVPAIPWCFDKTIMRLAMRGVLPEAVRLRPKSVPAGDPLAAMLAEPAARWVDRFEPIPALDTYVSRERIPPVCGEQDPERIWTNLRPLCLNYWLKAQGAIDSPARRIA